SLRTPEFEKARVTRAETSNRHAEQEAPATASAWNPRFGTTSGRCRQRPHQSFRNLPDLANGLDRRGGGAAVGAVRTQRGNAGTRLRMGQAVAQGPPQIGRASCRERGEIFGVGGD